MDVNFTVEADIGLQKNGNLTVSVWTQIDDDETLEVDVSHLVENQIGYYTVIDGKRFYKSQDKDALTSMLLMFKRKVDKAVEKALRKIDEFPIENDN